MWLLSPPLPFNGCFLVVNWHCCTQGTYHLQLKSAFGFLWFFNFMVPMDFSVTDIINAPVKHRKSCVLPCVKKKKLQRWNVLIPKNVCVCIWNTAQNVSFLWSLAKQSSLCFQWINPRYWSGSLMSTDEGSSAKWIIVDWSPRGLAAPVLAVYSSWVIATAPVTRGTHTGEQRSTDLLGKMIWNTRLRALGTYLWKLTLVLFFFSPKT